MVKLPNSGHRVNCNPSSRRALALVVLLITAVWGCASTGVTPSAVSVPAKEAERASPGGWWYARYVMNWPEGKDPSWSLDLLLAHRVVSPVLDRYRGDILLWRFHRRAARDPAGHQFSFIFHSSPEAARRVFAALQADATLGKLKERGVLVRDSYDDTSTISRPNLDDTSDRHWPPAIQKSWPYYIQGVSEMWLNLIVQMAGESSSEKGSAGLDDLLRSYEQLNAAIGRLWREEGQHAFLHHLNAIFGYESLMIREKRLMGF